MRISAQKVRLQTGKRRTKRRNRIVKACLMQRNGVHIPLTQQVVVLFRPARYVKPIQMSALFKNRRLRRVQILRKRIPHNTSAKCDNLTVRIHNREHNTVPELIAHAAFL